MKSSQIYFASGITGPLAESFLKKGRKAKLDNQ